ncbi:hypothetical protein CY34DRAFT_684340 [Suillus luteus UH-Slu-Lm8-n1]|uniref:Uncharacterized protein n=1 Tax=Suillus luteus UH-Slu-Lm8-n1 TaxID=930992 RepID=A0A0D0AHM4_9AGAM|nr:hypothetical protein CY34DRAFT_684340 [Suillus luteus UH-Slu-Lm8-n1]
MGRRILNSNCRGMVTKEQASMETHVTCFYFIFPPPDINWSKPPPRPCLFQVLVAVIDLPNFNGTTSSYGQTESFISCTTGGTAWLGICICGGKAVRGERRSPYDGCTT